MENKKVGVGFGVMILNDSKILLGQRHFDPAKADSELHGEGTWTMPGGKLNFGETFEDGACREVLEETGIKIDKKGLSIISLANDSVADAHFVTIGFLYEEKTEAPKVMEPDEITQWKWFDLNKLPSPMFFPSKEVVENYMQSRFYTPKL
jgi:8-oxo-dGTP diphosphatase